MSPVIEVTVHHLEMRERPTDAAPPPPTPEGVRFRPVPREERALVTQAMYRRVGAAWSWFDRATWSVAEWEALLEERNAGVWVVEAEGEAIGFAVLASGGGEVEILYFGLVPEWMGRGVGKWLLARVIAQAWALGPTRLRLETCSLDAPAALPNYLAHGFERRREERLLREVP